MMAAKTPIRCWGHQLATVKTSGHAWAWNFLQADVAFPILGSDFLGTIKMMVDISGRSLVLQNGQSVPLATQPSGPLSSCVGVAAAAPNPYMEDLTAKLAGCTVFSKLDLHKGFHQVPMAPEDVEKTAIITPFGLFEFLRMPFGLRNSGQSFQQFMDEVAEGLENLFIFMDDRLLASKNKEEHKKHLEGVMARFKQYGLALNAEKCAFFQTEVEYLGHLVSAEGISPLPAKVAAIREMPRPSTKTGLLSFLGAVNFYRPFIKGLPQFLSWKAASFIC